MSGRYTRYTLTVGEPAAGSGDGAPAPGSAGGPAPAVADAPPPAVADAPPPAVAAAPPGAIDYPHAETLALAPPGAIDYPHAEAVALARALGADGWQEDVAGIVFWLPDEPAPDPALLAGLRRLGGLEVAAEEDDWRLRWREYHEPVAIGPFHVRAPWHAPRPDLLDLCIDVGMAFGTGGHTTTRQCLAALAVLPRGSFVDLGTGSGVLALAAARLGFAPVAGFDIDRVAVEAARANAHANGLTVDFTLADATDPAVLLPPVDAAVANLALAPIVRLGRRVARRGSGGWRPPRLLLAGLLEEQGEQAAAAFPGYRLRGRAVDDGWLLLDLEEEGRCGCR